MLDVAKRLAAFAADAEVEFLDVFILPERRGIAVEHDAPGLQDETVIGIAQRDIGVLLGKQEGNALLFVQPLEDLEYLLDQLRR